MYVQVFKKWEIVNCW